jgi:arylsulfatase A-like enzyme
MPDRPNILLITADQLRGDALGCYANPICRTPHLDRLAAGGVLFERAYAPNPICVPSRASITTGNYSHRATGTKRNSGRIGADQVKLAEHFAAGGYRTYACGKLHYVPYSAPNQPRLLHGFQTCDLTESGRILAEFDPRGRQAGLEDYFDYLAQVGWRGYTRGHGTGNNDVRPCRSPLPAEHHVDHWVADRAIQRLREHAASGSRQPCLMWCSFPKPHPPYDPPAPWEGLYDPRELPPPVGSAELLEDRNPMLEYQRRKLAHDSLSPEALQVIRAYYYGLVSFQDQQVGRVLAELDRLGLAGDTLIIYTSDHGDLMGDFGTFFKSNFLEGSVRVPLILAGPGLPAGQRRRQLAGLQDLLPTLARLTDCPLPQAVDGLNLAEALRDADAPTRPVFYSQCLDDPHQSAMVTDGRWKYCYSQWGGVQELYDLQADPRELLNLATKPDYKTLSQSWRQRLIEEARRVGDDGLLVDGQLATSPLDRQELRQTPVHGMGWRWY